MPRRHGGTRPPSGRRDRRGRGRERPGIGGERSAGSPSATTSRRGSRSRACASSCSSSWPASGRRPAATCEAGADPDAADAGTSAATSSLGDADGARAGAQDRRCAWPTGTAPPADDPPQPSAASRRLRRRFHDLGGGQPVRRRRVRRGANPARRAGGPASRHRRPRSTHTRELIGELDTARQRAVPPDVRRARARVRRALPAAVRRRLRAPGPDGSATTSRRRASRSRRGRRARRPRRWRCSPAASGP